MHVEDLLPAIFFNFINLGTVFAIWKILPASRSNGKQNIQFQNNIYWQ